MLRAGASAPESPRSSSAVITVCPSVEILIAGVYLQFGVFRLFVGAGDPSKS